MEKINELLKELGNNLPASMTKRIEGLNNIHEKLDIANKEHNANPTLVSQEKLNEIKDFFTDTQDDLIEDLSELVAQKRETDLENRRIAKEAEQAKARARELAERKSRQVAKETEEAKAKTKELTESKARQDTKIRDKQKAKHFTETKARQAKEKEDLENKELLKQEPIEEKQNTDPDKKSGTGWGSLVLGGALLILSAGAINYFGKKR
jgi:hypothetical protein